MSEGYRFKEVRKGERDAVIAFAQRRGCEIAADQLRHHLSLTIQSAGETKAAALCLEPEPGRFTVELVPGDDGAVEEGLIHELADRCLRKMQATDIGAARIQSPTQEPTQELWAQANWLDRIDETPPADAMPGEQAA